MGNKIIFAIVLALGLSLVFTSQEAFAGGCQIDDLVLEKTVNRDCVGPGEEVTYTYTITNVKVSCEEDCKVTDDVLGEILPLDRHNFMVGVPVVVEKNSRILEKTTNTASLLCDLGAATLTLINSDSVTVDFCVGGSTLSPDSISLLVLEAESSAVWWLPAVVIAGAGLALFKIKKKN